MIICVFVHMHFTSPLTIAICFDADQEDEGAEPEDDEEAEIEGDEVSVFTVGLVGNWKTDSLSRMNRRLRQRKRVKRVRPPR